MTKPESTRSKSPWIILSLAAALVIGMVAWSFNHRKHDPVPVPPVAAKMPAHPSQPHKTESTARTPEEIYATANARPCDGTVLTHLDLSRPPSEGELIAAGNLGKKLTPCHAADPVDITDPAARKHQELDNLAFGHAIQAWNEHRYEDAIKLFQEHLQSFPNSPWAAESMLHIGCFCQYNSRFNESAEWFDKAISASEQSSEMLQKAKLRRAMINVLLGQLDEASGSLREFLSINTSSMDATYASYWLREISFLKKNEAAFRDCGQKSLAKVAEAMGMPDMARELYNLPSAGPHGFTAEELQLTALQYGLDPHPVNASLALDSLPVPFVAHYKDKHYVAVTSVSKDTVRLHDTRMNSTTDMPRASFEREWSGFAMLVKQPPEVQGINPAENLTGISGGCCGINMQQSNLGKDKCDSGCNSPSDSPGGTSGGPGGGSGSGGIPSGIGSGFRPGFGLPSHSVNPINMNFKVIDTPMWWDAPIGPDVEITLLFNSQEGQNNLTPFGAKWSFEYASSLMIDPGTQVQVKDGDGRIEMFITTTLRPPAGQPYPEEGITYTCNGDFRTLVETAAHTFNLIHQDGTVYRYGIPAAMAGTSTVPLLLSITDRHNNFITITHNQFGSIISIQHSALTTGSWSFNYEAIGSVFRVFRIDDPFGRSARFSYDSAGHLTGQTDMGGLSYSYGYTPTGGGAPLFMSAITKPTGSITIYTEPADGIYNNYNSADGGLYTQADYDTGYNYAYPLPGDARPGRIMWDNYRITVRDQLQNPTEYHYNALIGATQIRTPIQMARQPGENVSPSAGARTEIGTKSVGDRGEIDSVKVYDENGAITYQSYTSGFNESTRLPSSVSSGSSYNHTVTYNPIGRPTGRPIRINLFGYSGDSQIDYTYEPDTIDDDIDTNGIDPDTIKRSYNGIMKTLADFNYYPGSRDLQSVTDVTGRTLTYVWQANGLPEQITDSVTGDVISFTYDTNHRPHQTLVKTANDSQATVVSTAVYDAANRGNLESALSPDGRMSIYQYDDLNRVTRELRGDNTFTAYDWACCFVESVREGNLVGGTEKTLRRSVTFHDKRALPVFTTDTDGKTTYYQFDAGGRFVKLTDPKNQVTEWIYNDADQIKEKKFPSGPSEFFTYDSYGRPKTHTNRRGQIITLGYEYDGRIYSIARTNGVPNLYHTYDPWRRIKTVQQSSGSWSMSGTYTFAHDLLGRPTSIDGPWADDTISWAYDDATRSVTRTSPGGVTETNAANPLGEIASITNPLGTFTHNRSGLGELLQSITHSGGFNTSFGWHGDTSDFALHTITSTKPGGAVIGKHTYTYGTFGEIATWKREAPLANPSGPTRQFESKVFYDPAEQVSSLLHTPLAGSSVAESAHHYVYDTAGNIGSKQVEKPGLAATMTTYGHNTLNQLTAIGGSGGVKTVIVRGDTSEPASVKVKPGTSSTWKDAKMLQGQRFEADVDLATGPNQINVQAKDGSNNTSNYTYALNLAAATAATPAFDADGNMTSDGVRGYEWDIQNRLVKITWGAGSNKSTEFRYNALGQRSERIEKAGTTETAHHYYLYDGIRLLCRYAGGTAASNIDRRYFSRGEQRKNGATWNNHYYTRDHLGSIREVMNSDGTLAARYDYDPYGTRSAQYLTANYADGCDLGYTGHITQPSPVVGQSELVMTFFRAYDSDFGRWLSADPLEKVTGDLAENQKEGSNLYSYVGGGPIKNIDIGGLRIFRDENGNMKGKLYIGIFDPPIPFGFRMCPKMQGAPKRITNPKHHPKSESPEPTNVDDLFKNSFVDKNGVRWAKDANGIIHRFSKSCNGESHWNGSTGGNKPIQSQNIPNEILKIFGK